MYSDRYVFKFRLLSRISPEEEKALLEASKSCSWRLTKTKGIPLAFGLCVGHYFASQSFPKLLKTRGFGFYPTIGVMAIISADVLWYVFICLLYIPIIFFKSYHSRYSYSWRGIGLPETYHF